MAGEQVRSGVRVDVAVPVAPREEGAGLADALADGVVGQRGPVAGAPLVQIYFGDLGGVATASLGEQVGQFGSLSRDGPGVLVGAEVGLG